MTVLTNFQDPTLGEIRKVNVGVEEVVNTSVIIKEANLSIMTDQLVMPIRLNILTSGIKA